jgi:threonine/homoserine/homoserine lactone efflux protein
MWLYLLQGIGYGFSAAAQPGPFQTYLISQSLTRGWRRTLIAAFAPLVSDAPAVALSLFVLSQIPAWFEKILYLASGVFILYLVFGVYKTWRAFDINAPVIEEGNQQGLAKASLVNMLSPGPYIFWSLITGPILLKGWRETPAFGISLLIGFYATFILSLMLLIFLFGSMQHLGGKIQRVMLGISGIALFGFGVYQLWQGLSLI